MHPFRFAVNLLEATDAGTWLETCRRVEEFGYDTLLVPDHLGMPAPFPALVAAADATRLRVGTFVLNAGFYHPTLLARDAATTDLLTGGRLDLGLGAGYVREEFAAVGVEQGSPGEMLDRLERAVVGIRTVLADPQSTPRPAQPSIPLLLGGNGDRMLRMAARHADVMGFTSASYDPSLPNGLRVLTEEQFAARVDRFAEFAGDRSAQIVRNLLIQKVVTTEDRETVIRSLAHELPYLNVDEVLRLPVLLVGTTAQLVDQVLQLRERYGISYLTVLQPHMEAFAGIVDALRGA